MADNSYMRRRIVNELRNYQKERRPDDTVRIELVSDDMMHLKGYMKGVEGTPYAGGVFELEIEIGEMYPICAPKIKFNTKIWHPAVNPFDGTVCLHDTEEPFWPAPMTLFKTLLTIQSWMSSLDSKEPIDVEILEQARQKPAIFEKTAEFWTVKFAKARKTIDPEMERKVRLIKKLTGTEELAVIALSYHNWELPNDLPEY